MKIEVGDVVQYIKNDTKISGEYGEVTETTTSIGVDYVKVSLYSNPGAHKRWMRASWFRLVARGSGADIVPEDSIGRPKQEIRKRSKKKSLGNLDFIVDDIEANPFTTATPTWTWNTTTLNVPHVNTIHSDEVELMTPDVYHDDSDEEQEE